MNISKLGNEIIENLNITEKQDKKLAKDVVESLFDTIVKIIKRGDTLKIKDFGTFKVKVLKSRVIMVPFTKEEKTIPERKKIKFLPSNKVEL